MRDLDPLVRVSRTGLPATSEALDNTRPFLGRVDTFLREFTPIIDYLGLYKREIAAFFANDSAVTQAKEGNLPRYLRTQNPVNPEIMAAYPNRLATNRSNPYPVPGGSERALDLPRRRSGPTCAARRRCRRRPPPVPRSPRASWTCSTTTPGAGRRTVARHRPAPRSRRSARRRTAARGCSRACSRFRRVRGRLSLS